ncbi:MAG: flippase-like domain-containing protein [Deltaproteobacteria bacterium]|nr:flippase-like domain-containing protein [Deltaproteobacteria bacterium]
MNKSLNLKLWTGLFLSAVFMYLALRGVDLAKVWGVIKSADLFYILLIVVLTFFQFMVRTWRWAILLEPIKQTGFLNRLSTTLIGFGANSIFPARMGEFIRANYLGHRERISASSAFGTIVVERLFDGFTLLLVLVIGLLGTKFTAEWQSVSDKLRITGFILLPSYLIFLLFLLCLRYRTEYFLRLFDRLLFFLPSSPRTRVIDAIENFSLGIVLVRNPLKWILIVFYSLLVWFLNLYQVELVENAIGLDLPFLAAFLIMSMASFGVMIPSAPGYVGTFHLSVQYGFIFYGVGKEEALSAAILWHAVVFFPTLLFGLVSFLLLNIPLAKPLREVGIGNQEK